MAGQAPIGSHSQRSATMQSRRPGCRLASAVTVTLLTIAGAMTAVSPAGASAATCQAWVSSQPPSPGSSENQLNAVAVLSPCNAWAVGSDESSGGEQTLIEHWNGAAWTVVP